MAEPETDAELSHCPHLLSPFFNLIGAMQIEKGDNDS